MCIRDRNKLDAFEQTASILTAYKDEVENKNKELMEVKALSEIQATAITNLVSTFFCTSSLFNSSNALTPQPLLYWEE